jgi:hypothetical protein
VDDAIAVALKFRAQSARLKRLLTSRGIRRAERIGRECSLLVLRLHLQHIKHKKVLLSRRFSQFIINIRQKIVNLFFSAKVFLRESPFFEKRRLSLLIFAHAKINSPSHQKPFVKKTRKPHLFGAAGFLDIKATRK